MQVGNMNREPKVCSSFMTHQNARRKISPYNLLVSDSLASTRTHRFLCVYYNDKVVITMPFVLIAT